MPSDVPHPTLPAEKSAGVWAEYLTTADAHHISKTALAYWAEHH